MEPGGADRDTRFDEEPRYTHFAGSKPKGLPERLVEWGMAKDARKANYILVGFAIAAIILAFVIPSLLASKMSTLPSKSVIDAAMHSSMKQ